MVARTLVTGMAGTASKSTGVQIVGIDPKRRRKFSHFIKQ